LLVKTFNRRRDESLDMQGLPGGLVKRGINIDMSGRNRVNPVDMVLHVAKVERLKSVKERKLENLPMIINPTTVLVCKANKEHVEESTRAGKCLLPETMRICLGPQSAIGFIFELTHQCSNLQRKSGWHEPKKV
jgi:hypothetical protein